MKRIFYAVLTLLILQQCKTTSKIAGTSAQQDTSRQVVTDTLKISKKDTTNYLITQKGDTLRSLDSVVEKSVSRVYKDTIVIKAVGDIMMGTNFPSKKYLPPDSGRTLWKAVSSDLQNADITFGNLEGTILNDGGEQKKCNNPKACYLFRTPEFLTFNLADAGLDVMSLANNHANDFGITGRKNTQKVLDSLQIVHAGATERPYAIYRQKGYSVGVLAMSPNKGTVSIHDEEYSQKIIEQLDTITDIVIVSLHIGAEGSKNEHLTRKREFYYGEDRGNVYELSRKLIDWGADVIIGHGPHVVRAIDIYKNRLIAYSLGNFLTYGRFNLRGANAYAPVLEIKTNKEGQFLSGRIASYIQDYARGPLRDEQHRAAKKIKELTEIDLPETQLIIEETGKISYLKPSK